MKNNTTLTEYEARQIEVIKEWESRSPSVLSEALDTVLTPINWVTSKIVPNKVIEGALTLSNTAALKVTDKKDILRDGEVRCIKDLMKKDLELSDKLADSVQNWAIGIAAVEGGATGATGLPGMAVDIPTLITLALRTIHKIGLCYGFEFKNDQDTEYILAIMAVAGANTQSEKNAALLSLIAIRTMIAKNTWKKMIEIAAKNKTSKAAAIMTVKAVAKQLGVNLTKRKALQAIPIVGGVVGASMNASFIRDVSWASIHTFQKDWLIYNGKYPAEEDA